MALALDGYAGGQFSGTASGTASLTTTGTNDIIIVCVHNEASTAQSVQSISDSAGLSWARVANVQGVGGSSYVNNGELWWALAPAALSADTITVTLTGAIDDATIIAFGVSGATLSNPFDPNASLPAVAVNTAAPSVTFSTTQNDTFIIGFTGTNSSPVPSISGLTAITSVDNSSGSYYSHCWAGYVTESAPQTGMTLTGSTIDSVLLVIALTSDAAIAAGGGANLEIDFLLLEV